MTIRIAELNTELAAHDVATLRVMAERVVHDRPSFRTVTGRVGDEPSDIDAWVEVVQATHEALEGRPVQVAAKPSEKDTLNVDHGLFDNAKKVVADE